MFLLLLHQCLFKVKFWCSEMHRSKVYNLMNFDKLIYPSNQHPNQDKAHFHEPRECPYAPFHSTSILYVCIFIPVLQLGSSVPFFFRFHIYVLAYGICFSLSDLLHSVWQTLGPSTSVQITQFCFFLWLSNIPLYICTTSSLSIHVLPSIYVASMSCLL